MKNGINDWLYGTRLHYKLLDKYKHYFSSIFDLEVTQFGCIKNKKNGEFLGISNLVEHEELYLAHKGYEDDTHQVSYKDSYSQLIVTCADSYHGQKEHYSLFRQAINKVFGTCAILCLIEKKLNYYEVII